MQSFWGAWVVLLCEGVSNPIIYAALQAAKKRE
jgi:hypothetical protein